MAPTKNTETAPEPGVAQENYTGLTLEARRNTDSGHWEFGVELSGAFVLLAVKKLGRVDDLIRESIEPGFAQKRADYYNREVLGQH